MVSERPGEAELRGRLEDARRLVDVHRTYRHAGTGGLYRVESLAIDEATHEVRVQYRRLAGIGEGPNGHPAWSRPLREFLGGVVRDGRLVARFAPWDGDDDAGAGR